jgi:hypothetical protein
MRSPLKSLFVAMAFLFLGGLLLAPYSPSTKVTRPDETRTQHSELEVNWPAYICFAGAAAAFAWTVGLVAVGIVFVIRTKRRNPST